MQAGRAGIRAAGAVALGFAACIVLAPAAGAAASHGLLPAHFVPVSASLLPSSPATYIDATCPTERLCLAVGSSRGAGVVTRTGDGAATWTTLAIPGTAQLAAVSCPAADVCYAGGSAASGAATMDLSRDGGLTWTAQTLPTGAIVDSIGCGSPRACIAAGTITATSSQRVSVVTTNDGGAAWSPATLPGRAVNGVRCIDAAHCYAAGEGVWITADLGVSWTDISPSEGPATSCPTAGFCIGNAPVYSELIDVEFSSPSDGWVVGGAQCGGPGVTQCPGAVFHTTDAGTSWSLWAGSSAHPWGWQVACQGAACLVIGQGAGHSEVLATRDGATWSLGQTLPTTVYALGCSPRRSLCVAGGGLNGAAALYVSGASGGGGSGSGGGASTGGGATIPSTLGASLATPATLAAAPSNLLVNALLVLALIFLVAFPSHLFNRTYDENHDVISAWWLRHLPWTRRLQSAALQSPARDAAVFTAVVLVGGLLGSLLDPGFGVNARTLALYAGVVLAILSGVTVGALSLGVFRRLRHHREGRWRLRALPSGLLVAALCVLISRLTSFQPGYLYGVIGGVAFAQALSSREEGAAVAVVSIVTLVISVLAWLAWVPVSAAAVAHPQSFGPALLENYLAALFVSGMVGLLIGLVPVRFLPGEKLLRLHRLVWASVFAVVSFAVLEVMLRPQSSRAHVAGVPFWTTLALFLGFGLASIVFWAGFRNRRPVSAPA